MTEFVIIHFWKVLHYAAGDGANICAYYVEVSLCTRADHVKGLLIYTLYIEYNNTCASTGRCM